MIADSNNEAPIGTAQQLVLDDTFFDDIPWGTNGTDAREYARRVAAYVDNNHPSWASAGNGVLIYYMNRLATFPEYLNYTGIQPYIKSIDPENVISELDKIVDPISGTKVLFNTMEVVEEETPVNTTQTPLYQVIKTINDNGLHRGR